jgi:hypothetical protein
VTALATATVSTIASVAPRTSVAASPVGSTVKGSVSAQASGTSVLTGRAGSTVAAVAQVDLGVPCHERRVSEYQHPDARPSGRSTTAAFATTTTCPAAAAAVRRV